VAATPLPDLRFTDSCSDCGHRQIDLPEPLPAIGDDFDWLLRDYDGFRRFMLEELAARFPERRRWTPADMEVVIVETLAVVLDQFSDSLDRIHAEAFLESARRPESVRRLLAMIGYDAVALAGDAAGIPQAKVVSGESVAQRLQRLLRFRPALQQLIGDYGDELGELSAAQQLSLQAFAAAGEAPTSDQLDALQLFLDNAPEFVTRARRMALEAYWAVRPEAMDRARSAGPRAIHNQRRMVTEADYGLRIKDHPLVLNGHAFSRWSGSWSTLYLAVVLHNNLPLDALLDDASAGGVEPFDQLRARIDRFYRSRGIAVADLWGAGPSGRTLLRPYVDAYRLAGQEVVLVDAVPVGINISLSVNVRANYFQSEVRRDLQAVLGSDLGGFFEPGRLLFGEDLYSSDIVETAMALDGVEVVCLNRFKRVGRRFPDPSDAGRIRLDGLEIAVCDNDPQRPERGILRLTLHGGQRG
jgi:hypothetical protein